MLNCTKHTRSVHVFNAFCIKNNMTGVTSEAGTAYTSGVPKFTHCGVRVAQSLVFCV